ncbi:hypothetical protein HK096_001685, partial [Nowakowskiella sp. JEL0078]
TNMITSIKPFLHPLPPIPSIETIFIPNNQLEIECHITDVKIGSIITNHSKQVPVLVATSEQQNTPQQTRMHLFAAATMENITSLDNSGALNTVIEGSNESYLREIEKNDDCEAQDEQTEKPLDRNIIAAVLASTVTTHVNSMARYLDKYVEHQSAEIMEQLSKFKTNTEKKEKEKAEEKKTKKRK